jgi:pyruvate/2-oxoglutarate dehydrogenase complex dihydrolipoamide dehydrogenase (E3) component
MTVQAIPSAVAATTPAGHPFDLIVLGGGPAGVTAALRGAELGARVALVERSFLGGTCTNDGCVPTRVLAKTARLLRDAHQFAEYGLDGPLPRVDFARVLERAQEVVYQVHEKKQLLAHLQAVDITVFDRVGNARFVSPHALALPDGRTLHGSRFLLCVGGHARRLNFPGAEYAMVHSDVWRLTQLPERVVVVGGGATGCQLASVFNAFGSHTTLMELAPQLLLQEDRLIADTVTAEFRANGIEVMTGIGGIDRIEPRENAYDLLYRMEEQERHLLADAIILSVGWPGNLDELGVQAAGLRTRGPYIEVDDTLCTSQPHIYAAGDITGRIMLVQTASHQARLAVENALRDAHDLDDSGLVPHGGFTDPEYASVGITEAAAEQRGNCAVAVVPYADMDRAVIDGHPVGFCKLIVDRETRQVIGAHVVGEQAVEVVQIVATAMAGHMPIEHIAEIEYAYPTFAAVIGLAARQLARELDVIPITEPWHTLTRQRASEWERRQTS